MEGSPRERLFQDNKLSWNSAREARLIEDYAAKRKTAQELFSEVQTHREALKNAHKSVLSMPQHVLPKPTREPQKLSRSLQGLFEYLEPAQRFQNELLHQRELSRRVHHPIPRPFEYFAKLDELKVCKEQKLNEPLLRQLEAEKQRARARCTAENKSALDQQVALKRRSLLTQRLQGLQDREVLDLRVAQLQYLDAAQVERARQQQHEYADSLAQQLRQRSQQRAEIRAPQVLPRK